MDAKSNTDVTGNDREAWLTALYKKAFPLVAGHISKMGGSLEEARDIFQDALIIYYEKSTASVLTLKHSDEAYLFGIARYLWNKRYKESSGQLSIDQLNADFDEQAGLTDTVEGEISTSRLFKLLQTAGQKCMQLLSAFYYEKLSMEQLAGRFGFSGPRSATAQKFKCLEKVKETVKEKSIRYEDIFE
ncbi:RNA polymerase sigma factor [Pedobacter heparinus]|uniref:RNA polymerase sigma factor, sigma-70 family n=1 Tax=Pedobacter heparinus (strain ATCC 13125 / DSM 2366 / CIP 104194 / JCM 7457 / NBRC 12017 / NCIMB 9290 / NRRL B-14731 / HIM 762-3) TaxID=485917 RepID=C6Y0W5_PEDHD|nr:sigma-70 family RNA polymerase sigma factor [Pedobacter heparinus]ACU04892.1 RNA polymerase sigma factor, sigma-70 family [Pedobacter heparinus DSM 2366]